MLLAEERAAASGRRALEAEGALATSAASAAIQWDAARQARLTQEALQAAIVEAERVTRAIEDFFTDISHEMRTPLSAIVGLSQLLERGTQTTDAQRLEYNTAIYNAGQHLLGLVNNLLDMAQLRAGKLRLEAAPMDVADVLRECASLEAPLCTQNGLRFNVNLNPNLPPAVIGDAMRVRQIVLNLLTNAIKYTLNGEVASPRPSLHLTLSQVALTAETRSFDMRGACIRITVRDSGPGIDPIELRRLFNRFTQSSSVPAFKGSGLGLSIVKQLCDLMGGGVEVRLDRFIFGRRF